MRRIRAPARRPRAAAAPKNYRAMLINYTTRHRAGNSSAMNVFAKLTTRQIASLLAKIMQYRSIGYAKGKIYNLEQSVIMRKRPTIMQYLKNSIAEYPNNYRNTKSTVYYKPNQNYVPMKAANLKNIPWNNRN